jgi:hypothetical protein
MLQFDCRKQRQHTRNYKVSTPYCRKIIINHDHVNQWSLRIRLKHEKSMDVDDEQITLNVVTCNQNNQYDNVTWYEWLF